MASPPPEVGGDAGAPSSSGTMPQDISDMSKSIIGQLQAAEQEGSAQTTQQVGQPHMNPSDQLSQPTLVTGDSENENFIQQEQHHYQPEEQPRSENQLQQAEANNFQLAEKGTDYVGQQSLAGSMEGVTQPSLDQQHVNPVAGQQPAGAQETRKRGYQPSIPFNMLIPILQAHLDRDKDMQLQSVWAKLRRNEVHKDDFLRVIRNIVGDQMLKQAAHKVFAQMQAQAQRNNQGNANQHSVSSQASTQQSTASGSAKLPDQQVRMPTPPNQGQKSQASSSPQTFVPLSGTQMQNSMHYFTHDNSIQTSDAKGVHAMPNRPPSMNPPIPLQTSNKQPQPSKIQQGSQQLYGTTNTPQSYPRPISGSMPLRPQSLTSETRPPLHSHGMVPAKIGTLPTHPTMQQNAPARPMQQTKDMKNNAYNPNANTKQDSESAGKARQVGTGGPSAKLQGKQAAPKTSTPPAARTNKKSGGQKKSLEMAGSAPAPSSKRQKTAGAFQEQSIDQLNDVTAVSGVNLREEEEQLLSAPKEESAASEAARRIVQEEEENLFLQRGPLLRKLAEIILKCNLKNAGADVERCLSMCVEERLRRFISTLIRVSKQRIDTEKTGHRLVITSDVGRQILLMNQKAKEEWDKKQAETDKNKKQTEEEGSGAAELDKEKEESRPKNAKPNKEEDDKMRTTAANVAARQAVGGSDMLSKWQLMAEQARQKRAPVPRPSSHASGKGSAEQNEASKRSHFTAFGTEGTKRQGKGSFATRHSHGPQRTVSVKDVICVLEREPQMTKSRLIYRLYERLPGDSTTD